ncbi:hypothetical protein PWT90_06634 [Aphanocladium album]|nr:hypothetical protein PWT90_06634 [Aphanocladium album]
MATLESLKSRLRDQAQAVSSLRKGLLSNKQYEAGFENFALDLGKRSYDNFIIPQLSRIFQAAESYPKISVLEIGPGPKTVLGQLPPHIRQSIAKYTALEPNKIFATRLERYMGQDSEGGPPFPCLERPADIHIQSFTAEITIDGSQKMSTGDEVYDMILFCHSMYGMKPKSTYLQRALGMLDGDGILIVFHRGESLFVENMVCHRTACFPTGRVSVKNRDHELDCFAMFIAGFEPLHATACSELMAKWRKTCREMGHVDSERPDSLQFSSPEIMVSFTKNALSLPELIAKVPLAEHPVVKNRDARLQQSAARVVPRDISEVQACVRWAIENKCPLTVLSGGHSDHCVRSNVVAIDMAGFREANLIPLGGCLDQKPDYLLVAGCGCRTEDILRKSMEESLIVPLGARPSIGSGLWLQGGIGHMTRQHGLTCDAIVGAVLVTLDTAQVMYVGQVPASYQPPQAKRATNEAELLWALKGGGTSLGIVTHVVFKTFPATMTSVRSWTYVTKSQSDVFDQLSLFEDSIAKKLPRRCSSDLYLQHGGEQLLLGGTFFEHQTNQTKTSTSWPTNDLIAMKTDWHDEDAVGLFNADLYMTSINGGHKPGKTSSFKRCVFLKEIRGKSTVSRLVRAFDSRPTNLCYLHLVHGGGAANDIAANDTAFGCRDWSYACVITAVWPREQDTLCVAAKRWVYRVVKDLLPLSSGIYGADLGPDPRDAVLAQGAFGPNLARLSRLKRALDPFGILVYACPLSQRVIEQKMIMIVTGKSCAGKDFCADIWASVLATHGIAVHVRSISDVTKAEYSRATGADLHQLLHDRTYKEIHRERLTAFFQSQVQWRPQLPEEHFRAVVQEAADVDVLLITGMRDPAPVAEFSHLCPHKKLVEINVTASHVVRHARKRDDGDCEKSSACALDQESWSSRILPDYCPDFIFENSTTGESQVKAFAEKHLVPLLSEARKQLADMIPIVPHFPQPEIEFRHVLNIAQDPRGLRISTSLLQSCVGDWKQIDAIASCEAGGYIFAAPLALQVGIRFVPVRKSGKVPPPTLSAAKGPSHISSPKGGSEETIEMDRNVLSPTESVVVVDDVLATGRTLLAILQLLRQVGIEVENIVILVVAEFPIHRGRAFLRQNGFGLVRIQSLLVFSGI